MEFQRFAVDGMGCGLNVVVVLIWCSAVCVDRSFGEFVFFGGVWGFWC